MENFDVGGRPLFEKERFRINNPAAFNYSPEQFTRYDKSTRSFNKKHSIPNEIRFQKKGEITEASPATYVPEHTKDYMQRKKVAHSIPRMKRKLLDRAKTNAPGPQSYDTVTGLSMCSSTQQIFGGMSVKGSRSNLKQSQSKLMNQISFQMKVRDEYDVGKDTSALLTKAETTPLSKNGQAELLSGLKQTSSIQQLVATPELLHHLNGSPSRATVNISESKGSLALAPHIRGGTIGNFPRKTDWPTGAALK